MPPDAASAFEEHRPLMLAIAYDMLGSWSDAEDCVQDAFVRWHRAWLGGETEAVRAPRSYLSRIVTNRCIDQLRSARVRREVAGGVALAEPVLTADPAERVEMAEILSIGFLRLMETLSPLERAVFILRQAFGYEYAEISAILGRSEHGCRQILYRARRHIDDRRPRYPVSAETRKTLIERFMLSSSTGDTEQLLHLLTRDVVLYSDGGESAEPIHGARAVVEALLRSARRASGDASWEWQPVSINGQPAAVVHAYGRLHAVFSFEFEGQRIHEIDIVARPARLRSVGPRKETGPDVSHGTAEASQKM